MSILRMALGQINTTVGDFKGNLKKVIDCLNMGRENNVDMVIFPELTTTGYPPEDLLLKPSFIEANLNMLKQVISSSNGIGCILGFVEGEKELYNSAAFIYDGRLLGTCQKLLLPNYGVFDEKRYFTAGDKHTVFDTGQVKLGVNICEDIWFEDVTRFQSLKGDAEIIINISSSPYHRAKWKIRQDLISMRATDNNVIIVYVNQVGGQDELVFDGQSLVMGPNGEIIAMGKHFEEDFVIFDIDTVKLRHNRLNNSQFQKRKALFQATEKLRLVKLEEWYEKPDKKVIPFREIKPLCDEEEIYSALVLGLRDYVRKNGFKKVVLGLSGGIDSALSAAIAVDALGKEHVTGVAMPSMYSSEGSVTDARKLAENLGIEFMIVPITDIFNSYEKTFSDLFKGLSYDVTEENLQARIRGNILMALSNKFNSLVLATGNKSEISVGYCTLYGDMVGGFSVIKDLPKELVYKLSRYKNTEAGYCVIPENTIDKPPSAELRPEQKDEDSLPPYPVLDPILEAYVEENKSIMDIVNMGYKEEVVKDVMRLVDRSEFKRRQGAPGIKITPRAFGKDRRMPVTNGYRG